MARAFSNGSGKVVPQSQRNSRQLQAAAAAAIKRHCIVARCRHAFLVFVGIIQSGSQGLALQQGTLDEFKHVTYHM